jgi:hypothetical protein
MMNYFDMRYYWDSGNDVYDDKQRVPKETCTLTQKFPMGIMKTTWKFVFFFFTRFFWYKQKVD